MVFINSNIKQTCEQNSFTGLFALLKRYRMNGAGYPVLAIESQDAQAINRYLDEAIGTLLQGLQEIGRLHGLHNKLTGDSVNLGFFISTITNLIEALDDLRGDSAYTLLNSEN